MIGYSACFVLYELCVREIYSPPSFSVVTPLLPLSSLWFTIELMQITTQKCKKKSQQNYDNTLSEKIWKKQHIIFRTSGEWNTCTMWKAFEHKSELIYMCMWIEYMSKTRRLMHFHISYKFCCCLLFSVSWLFFRGFHRSLTSCACLSSLFTLAYKIDGVNCVYVCCKTSAIHTQWERKSNNNISSGCWETILAIFTIKLSLPFPLFSFSRVYLLFLHNYPSHHNKSCRFGNCRVVVCIVKITCFLWLFTCW